jgi:hypothetical protein
MCVPRTLSFYSTTLLFSSFFIKNSSSLLSCPPLASGKLRGFALGADRADWMFVELRLGLGRDWVGFGSDSVEL